MSSQNVAAILVLDWGHECVNALQDRILEHTGYLLMAARWSGLIRVDASGPGSMTSLPLPRRSLQVTRRTASPFQS